MQKSIRLDEEFGALPRTWRSDLDMRYRRRKCCTDRILQNSIRNYGLLSREETNESTGNTCRHVRQPTTP
eukprot:165405-Karenia_brevis.AAC.1